MDFSHTSDTFHRELKLSRFRRDIRHAGAGCGGCTQKRLPRKTGPPSLQDISSKYNSMLQIASTTPSLPRQQFTTSSAIICMVDLANDTSVSRRPGHVSMPTTPTHPERRKTVRRRDYTPPPRHNPVFSQIGSTSTRLRFEVDPIRENTGLCRGEGVCLAFARFFKGPGGFARWASSRPQPSSEARRQ